ncbi:penicillin-binding transpeptidase domain-containing protein [Escherichia coli]
MKTRWTVRPVMKRLKLNNRGRVIRQLKEVPPQAGHDIYLTLDLKLQQYIETLLAGSRAAVVVTDPRTGGVLGLVSTPSYDPNLFVDGISSKDYSALLNDPNTPLVNRATQGVYPPASTVKPYVAVSALSAGVITRNTTLFRTPAGGNFQVRKNVIVTGKNGATGV